MHFHKFADLMENIGFGDNEPATPTFRLNSGDGPQRAEVAPSCSLSTKKKSIFWQRKRSLGKAEVVRSAIRLFLLLTPHDTFVIYPISHFVMWITLRGFSIGRPKL